MRSYVLVLMFGMVSSNADAETIGNIRQTTAVDVRSVRAKVSGSGFPVTQVKVKAVFSNPCTVPNPDELVSIVNYGSNYSTLTIALGVLNTDRVCTQEFNPVTVTIDLGQFTHPTDGRFSRISVNKVLARPSPLYPKSQVLRW
jgi:hypothetical protein